ncbi:peptidoglycan recognition protein [Nephila pilipes]|uniref:Peptidoglycan recognition protein n=1 Tax=Nephila pilipes TaxID=299642 RepID=A0A8X6PD98_NEPPI|nr:peptidoglycan recognition protein [Nephila pilipes]
MNVLTKRFLGMHHANSSLFLFLNAFTSHHVTRCHWREEKLFVPDSARFRNSFADAATMIQEILVIVSKMKIWIIMFPLIFAEIGKAESSIKDISVDCDDVNIVSREEWRARNPMRVRKTHLPLNHIIILHTVTDFCTSLKQCRRNVQFIQDMHLDDRGWWDIAYSFLVGGDGNVYEGRGWFNTGSFAVNYNQNSLGIAFIGNFNKEKPTQKMLNATLNLLKCGVKKGYLSPTREIHGHRDVACTESPGNNLYAVIRNWQYFKGGRLPNYYCKTLPPPDANKDIINE